MGAPTAIAEPQGLVGDPPGVPVGDVAAGRVAALDGLRGLAVALVVLYHFAPDLLPAGFLGVDVFFVLSGFLITSLALAEHRGTGSFAMGAFFARRARRLLPAAVATVAVVVAVASVVEPAVQRQGLRGQAVASLLYGANWWSIAQGDSYQAAWGSEPPLTHFWSLAVEEQFYLLFPLVVAGLVVLAARWGRGRRAVAWWLLALASIGALASAARMAALHVPFADPSRAYLGSDTRAQAVLVGVAAGCAVHLWRDRLTAPGARRTLVALAAAGLGFLLWASWSAGFHERWLYDGGFLAVALASAAVTVAVALHRGALSRAFEVRALCGLGLVSYGVYLWHWPVRVFVDGERTGLDGVALFAVRLGLTAVATALSYRLVEQPFRRRRAARGEVGAPRLAPVVALATAAAVLVAVWVVARPATAPATAQSAAEVPTVPEVPATVGAAVADATEPAATAADPAGATAPHPAATVTGPLKVLWAGDSVAWTLGGGVLAFPQPEGYESPFDPQRIVIWNKGHFLCPLYDDPTRSLGVERDDGAACGVREQIWPAAIREFQPHVVSWSGALRDTVDTYVDGRWITFGSPEWDERYLAGLAHLRELATAEGAMFLLVGQADPLADPDEPYEEAIRPENVWRFEHLRQMQQRFAEAHPADTRYVDLQRLMCTTWPCPDRDPAGAEYRPDGVHYSLEGGRSLAPALTEEILAAVAGRA